MKQPLTRALVSWAYQCATNRSRRLSLCLCISILLLAVVPAWGSTASPGRIVLANGKLHWIQRTSGGFTYSRGQPNGDWLFALDDINVPKVPGAWPCNKWSFQMFYGDGLAVFGNKVWVAYTADADCSNKSAGMAAYVSAFDLTPTDAAKDGQWVLFQNEKGPPPVYPLVQYNKIATSSVRTDTPGKGWGSGAAITVFNNQLYLFTNNGVYTSGDGTGWTYRNRPFSINALREAQHEPLDAVTINTPDGPRILIVYGAIMYDYPQHYSHIDTVDWNGKFSADSQARIYNCTNGCAYDPNDSGLYDPSGHFIGQVSLTAGTKAKGSAGPDGDLAAGELKPAVQLFGLSGEEFTTSDWNPARHAEYVYTTMADGWGTWTWDSTRIKYFYNYGDSLWVYPWSEYECNNSYLDRQAMRQRIVLLGGFNWWRTPTPFKFVSDFLIPQHQDNNPACTYKDPNDGKTKNYPPPAGTHNDTSLKRSDYWNLVGVILGSPPFSDQGLVDEAYPDPDQMKELSGVTFDQTTKTGTETTTEIENTLSASVGKTILGGIGGSFDATYKHTWEKESGTKSTLAVSITHTVGTTSELKDMLGKKGWALFSNPHVYVQEWTVYGYDYKFDAASGGTALSFPPDGANPDGAKLNLQTLSSKGSPNWAMEQFDLRDPTENGTKPYFTGMGKFNYTDIYNNPDSFDFWQGPKNLANNDPLDWQNDKRWETRAGDGGTTPYPCLQTTCIAQALATSGSYNHINYSLEKESIVGSGHTNEIELKAGASVPAGLGLGGFSLPEGDLSIGYTGKFSWNTKTTTGTGTSVTAYGLTPSCGETSCFDKVYVQTYWLHPTADAASKHQVPWIPTAYESQLPWCLTWKVTCACFVGEDCEAKCGSGAGSTMPPQGVSGTVLPRGIGGTALPPANAFGRIVNGSGGDDGGAPYSHYVIQGGRLAWANNEGVEQRIPMTADDFVASKGVTIEVAGGSWSSSGNGSWKRNGETWTFQTNPSAKPSVTLSLDFGSATYDLNIQNADLNGRMLAGITNTRLVLGVNQRYRFYTMLHHDIDITWRGSKPPADNLTMHVTSFSGRYNSTNQSGNMAIAGTLPAVLPGFGDIEIDVNNHPYIVRLLTMDGFQEAFENGSVFRYSKQGLVLLIDFGKKTWSATFNQKAFQSLAPEWGSIRARMVVGGVPWLTEDNAVLDYSANVKLRR